ncbi:hypothetical protein E4U16_002876 [Claviceps sp. LM84 group G4]|nr:hypothetical protein E4U16_002876 [Claviceps sp. LM84 group G4]
MQRTKDSHASQVSPMQSGQVSGLRSRRTSQQDLDRICNELWWSNIEYRPSQVKRERLGRSDRGRARPTASTADGKEKSTSTQGLAAVLVSISQVGHRPWPGQARHSHFGPVSVTQSALLALDVELACGSAILHSLHCRCSSPVTPVQVSFSQQAGMAFRRTPHPAAAATPPSSLSESLESRVESLLPAANFQVTKSQLPTAPDIQVLLQQVTELTFGALHVHSGSVTDVLTPPSPSPAHLAHGLGVWMMLRLPVCGQ